MKNRTKFDLYVEQLLQEMPQMIHGDLGFVRNEKQNAVHLQYIKDNWELDNTITVRDIILDVWINESIKNDIELTFIDKYDQILARCEYTIINDDTINMSYIWQMRHAKELIASIFIEYLLPQYKNIISDNIQTALGFRFYQKMFSYSNVYNFHFSVIDTETDEEITISDSKQLNDYFGDNDNFAKYRFKISK